MARAKPINRKKLETKRKKRFDIEELNAYATAYGAPIGTKEYVTHVAMPGLIFGFFATIIYYNVLVTVGVVIIGILYGLWVLLPNVTRRKYDLASLSERGRYMTLLAQIATNPNKSMYRILFQATERLDPNGELYNELVVMAASIGSDIAPDNVRYQFKKLRDKYQYDPTFCQFMEQVETGLLNGNNNADILQEIEANHAMNRVNKDTFIKAKDSHFGGYRFIVGLVVFLTIMASVTLGLGKFIEGFSRTWVGLAFGIPFLGANMYYYVNIMKIYFDDDIMSISKK